MRIFLSATCLMACLLVVTLPNAVLAQDGWSSPSSGAPTSAEQPPLPPGDPPPVPINGALALLAIAGGAYAVRRLRRDDA
jgi:hypothetical protein